MGRFYPAYETAEELDRRRKRQQALGCPPIYDCAALRLTPEARAALEAEGRRPHWRFWLEPQIVRWSDLVRGERHIDCASLSDPVLQREDGSYLYTLPSVVDDIDLKVTTSFAARITSPTPPCRSRFSRRFRAERRCSAITTF
jgi:glutamyl-tRNA synthetase